MSQHDDSHSDDETGGWWRTYLGGILLLAGGSAVIVLGAHIEDATSGLLVGVVLVALVTGACVTLFGIGVMPAALLLLLVFMALGAGMRGVLPRPATVFEFDGHRLLPELAGHHTVTGGRNARAVTHRLVPLVAAGWRPDSAPEFWVFDPPAKLPVADRLRALRLPLGQRSSARAAWQSAVAAHALPPARGEPVYVELLADPAAEDERRCELLLAGVLGLAAIWVVGLPVARLCAVIRRRMSSAAADAPRGGSR